MKIEKIVVKKYKGIENFELDFSTNTESILSKNYNLSLLIGENGTFKTTFFQLILEAFTDKSFEKNMNDVDYTIDYSLNGKNYTYYSSNNNQNIKVKCYSFSYGLIDKLKLNTSVRTNYSNKYIRDVSNEMLEQFLTRNDVQTIRVFEKLGVKKNQLFFELRQTPYPKIKDGTNDEKLNDVLESIKNELSREMQHYYFKNLDRRSRSKESNVLKDVKALYSTLYFFCKKSELNINTPKIGYKKKYCLLSTQFVKENSTLLEKFTRLSKFISYDTIVKEIWCEKNKYLLPITDMSSGELSFILRMEELIHKVEDHSIILIDEPEIHLHPRWISEYISLLDELFKGKKCHFIIATHSPLLVANVEPENLIGLKQTRDGNLQQKQIDFKSFGADVDRILNEVFYAEPNESRIVQQYIKETRKKLYKENSRKEGVERYHRMGDSGEKFQLFNEFYKIIKEYSKK
ncbi:putative ATP-binding protein involved in virulence [Enterococcus rotai]|uniref:Endonuclease GajA/Old nuclease/RecF-like AAA domain-containing protein n=1 Tax=Enterococcus rotai TaxID=118060 RepID=A0A0U2XIH7_9ENTE|nr:AAA family ATPase [Enterococcus rotai]ALS38433.1 hypothetical protein ATZ35_15140 [Enterococcus rotai]